jgi:hypothetical protein
VETTVPGLTICEHLPRIAQQLHRCTLLRSVHHRVVGVHASAAYLALTGQDRGERRGGPTPEDYPALGSVLSWRRPPGRPALPYVALPHTVIDGELPVPGFFGGFLGRTYDPFFILKDPNEDSFDVPGLSPDSELSPARLEARRSLLRQLDDFAVASSQTDDFQSFRQRTYDLLGSPGVRRAFRIDEEPDAARQAYGRTLYGQSVLLARRLIEGGTRLVVVNLAADANSMNWDHHRDIFYTLRSRRLPELDACVSSLLADLADRGRLERTLVVVMGEFGRSPRVNREGGRDHWSGCYSVLVAGGGLKGGYVHGSSDRIGAEPRTCPLGPADLLATIYHCLGIAPDSEVQDRQNRPFHLVPWGRAVPQLLT